MGAGTWDTVVVVVGQHIIRAMAAVQARITSLASAATRLAVCTRRVRRTVSILQPATTA